jgi:fatty acid CoA ligase FadD32
MRAAHWAKTTPAAPAYTFVCYRSDLAGARETLTWQQVDARARAIAVRIRRTAEPGDRVAILAPSGLDYVIALLGACYARTIAVPLFSPDRPGHRARLTRALNDSEPCVVLTTTAALPHVEALFPDEAVHCAHHPLRFPVTIAVDEVDETLAGRWRPESIEGTDIAYLQYTSGSTGQPTGVVVTHANLTANVAQFWAAFRATPGKAVTVSWLPLFHDMGLVLTVLLPLMCGDSALFMDPVAFLMRPVRWLELASASEDIYTAGPNFAYDYCAKRVAEADKQALDLSRLRGCINAAEPIRPTTITRFNEAFASCGLRPEVHTPAYGLAEATAFVAAGALDVAPLVTAFDTDALALGWAKPCAESGTRALGLVACGKPEGQRVLIVDPQTRRRRAPGEIGEIWVSGPNVAGAYWRSPERSAEVFGATPAGDGPGEPSAGSWLRTGDLGVLHEGRLYVTGRRKDLIIIDGRNHYPQDIEGTVHATHPTIRLGKVAAFSVPGDDTERVVVVVEGRTDATGAQEVARSVRKAVKTRHDLRVHEVVLAQSGAIQRTSSGKLARRATRQNYLDGTMHRVPAS